MRLVTHPSDRFARVDIGFRELMLLPEEERLTSAFRSRYIPRWLRERGRPCYSKRTAGIRRCGLPTDKSARRREARQAGERCESKIRNLVDRYKYRRHPNRAQCSPNMFGWFRSSSFSAYPRKIPAIDAEIRFA